MSADHVTGKVVVVTGAAGGFGRLVCQKAAAKGAKVFGLDVNWDGLKETYNTVKDAGGDINVRIADVTDLTSMKEAIAEAVAAYGAVDVMINNAGTMPLAFFSDHEKAIPAWHKCIDINIKGGCSVELMFRDEGINSLVPWLPGVLNGIVSVYDQMIKQGRGHVINLSSIYGESPLITIPSYLITP